MNKYLAYSILLAAVLTACGGGNLAVRQRTPVPTPTATPTSTQTATAMATAMPMPMPVATPELGVWRLTWYGEEFRGGPLYCGSDVYGYYDPADPTTVAAAGGAFPCGTRLKLCADTCIVVVVKDRCGGCGPQHLDASRAAWEELGRSDYVTVEVIQ